MRFIGRIGDESTNIGLGCATVGSSKPGWKYVNENCSSYSCSTRFCLKSPLVGNGLCTPGIPWP